MKNKTLILILALVLIVSISFNFHFFNSNTSVQQTINNDISSQLSLLSGSLETLKESDNLRFISSMTGSVFWLSRSSNKIDHNTTELFQELNNFFINADINNVYENRKQLSEFIKKLSIMPNDMKTKTDLKNLIETIK